MAARPAAPWAGRRSRRPACADSLIDDGNANPPGACTQLFEIKQSSRIVAGGPIQGGIFKCALESVDAAIADGDYGSWTPSTAERARLMEIFPDGVCDWSQGDVGQPMP